MSEIIIKDKTVEVTVTYKGVYETDDQMIDCVKAAKQLKGLAVDETELLDECPNSEQVGTVD